MVDLTRRKTVIGLGLLATGSGATFTSAAFASDVAPGSDMRVVAGQGFDNNLRVEAGDIFRNGDAEGTFNPDIESNAATVKDLDEVSFFTDPGGTRSPLNGGENGISVQDLPAAGANDEENDDLELAVATKIGEIETIGNAGFEDNGFIQIDNNTPDTHDIGIRFDDWGVDVTEEGGSVTRSEVIETYKFYNMDGKLISPYEIDGGTQQVEHTVTVGPGQTAQIYLEVDTEEHSDSIMDAASVEDSPFENEQDTVDLVDSIRVGVVDE